jgi:hypothetical protein
LKYLLALLFISCAASADSATDRDGGLFFGGGFGMNQQLYNLGSGSTPAKFMDQGYAFEGGMTMPWGNRIGAQISGEYGQSSGNNTYNSQSTLETGSLKFYTAKAGLFYGPVTLGAGYRHNDVNIKSLQIAPDSYLETNYSGWTSLLYANYSLDIKKRFRTAIEGQYVSGSLAGSGAATTAAKLNETSISLRFFFLFD